VRPGLVEIDAKGRKRRRYRRYQTPLETLLLLPNAQPYLRPGLTLATLKRISKRHSDTEAARLMQDAKQRLFGRLRKSEHSFFKGAPFPGFSSLLLNCFPNPSARSPIAFLPYFSSRLILGLENTANFLRWIRPQDSASGMSIVDDCAAVQAFIRLCHCSGGQARALGENPTFIRRNVRNPLGADHQRSPSAPARLTK
jgi:hypothetical protein